MGARRQDQRNLITRFITRFAKWHGARKVITPVSTYSPAPGGSAPLQLLISLMIMVREGAEQKSPADQPDCSSGIV
jgi:hypothetical protein